MPPTLSPDPSPQEQRGSSPTLFYALLVIVVLVIVGFLVLRPGRGRPIPGNPASPAKTQH